VDHYRPFGRFEDLWQPPRSSHERRYPPVHRISVGLKPTIRNIYADDDAVIVFFDASGTARDGKPCANTYAWFFEMHDGKVVKAWAFFDSVEFNEFWQRVTPAESIMSTANAATKSVL
jgi:ketosteroid isomerase-like protein